MTKVMEHFDDKCVGNVMRRAGSIVMTVSLSNLMKSVMEYFDDKGYGTL